jgi:hypothetical protein
MITDNERWIRLQEQAEKRAKENLLAALLEATGLDEYIAEAIEMHCVQNHGD